jgi:DNA-binding transcriptional LysR family regulator
MRGTEFAELRAFAAVAEQGNFARAAARLRLSPSSLSQIIRGLEARIGVRLLNRTTRSLSLTPAGERLLTRFKPAMAEMAAAVEHARALQGRPAGAVRCGCTARARPHGNSSSRCSAGSMRPIPISCST